MHPFQREAHELPSSLIQPLLLEVVEIERFDIAILLDFSELGVGNADLLADIGRALD